VTQPIEEGTRGARLAERDRVQPQHRLAPLVFLAAIEAKALADVLPVAGLATSAPPQAQRHERQCDIPEQRVEHPHRERRVLSTPSNSVRV
jgi:hypothetical protein